MYPPGKRQPNDFAGYRRLRCRQKMCREIMVGAATHILAAAVTAAAVWTAMTLWDTAKEHYWSLYAIGAASNEAALRRQIHEGPQRFMPEQGAPMLIPNYTPMPEFKILPPG